MTRSNKVLGEVTQSPRGKVRGAAAAVGADAILQPANSGETGAPPKRRILREPFCKTCKDVSCTGNCRF